MKKKILTIAVLISCLAVFTSGTLAYFTAEDTAHNVITSGAVDIVIEEWQETKDGSLVPYPKDKSIEVMPGTVVSKIVTIKNNDEESFIRAKLEVVIKDASGKTLDILPETLSGIVSVVINDTDWKQKAGEAHWWYYTSSVDTDEVTEPLLTDVVFDGKNMTNEYQNCTIEINVDAQAVQTTNNGDNALEAAGWPKK